MRFAKGRPLGSSGGGVEEGGRVGGWGGEGMRAPVGTPAAGERPQACVRVNQRQITSQGRARTKDTHAHAHSVVDLMCDDVETCR